MLTGKGPASIKWKYYTAGTVTGYTITRHETIAGSLSLVGTLTERDRYKLSHRPLIFVAPYTVPAKEKGGTVTHAFWRWPILEWAVTDAGRLTARLGPELIGPELEEPKSLCLDL
jgi:hypothetical protein